MKNKLLLITVFALFSFINIQSISAQNKSNKEKIITLTSENFDKNIKKGVVLVDFWATWCRPCLMQNPILEKLADTLKNKISIGKLDIDKNKDIAKRYGISRIPTTIIFVDGKAIDKELGVQSIDMLLRRLSPYIKK
ncbi:MAG: thioredoxin [Bacteroidales bacterium]|jgi:thioredoxin 1|nr:thioredoxin [Bacteroidales bacterium]